MPKVGCPACAKTIDTADATCSRCGHRIGDPVAPVTPRQSRRGLVLTAFAIFGGLIVLGLLTDRAPVDTESQAPPLNVSVGRSAVGLTVTNREPSEISRCDVSVHEGADVWTGLLTGTLAPLASTSISWEGIKATNDQTIPGYIGRAADRYVVSCILAGSARERRSVVVRF